MTTSFQPGQRVKLLSFEGEPEQKATVVSFSKGFYYVEVDQEHRSSKRDDGLREIFGEDAAEQMEALV